MHSPIRFTLATALMVVVLMASPAAGQGAGRNCDISGTWYSGAFLVTIAPVAADRYSFVADYGFEPNGEWYSHVTKWTGDVVRSGAQTFDVYALNYSTWKNPEVAAGAAAALSEMFGTPVNINPAFAEIDAVRSRMRLADCNTLTNVVDVLWAYFPSGPDSMPVPFVSAPALDWLMGATIPETYTRMPVACPSCGPSPELPASTPGLRRGKGVLK